MSNAECAKGGHSLSDGMLCAQKAPGATLGDACQVICFKDE